MKSFDDQYSRQAALGRAAWLLLALISYASLLPFQYNGLTPSAALADLAAAPLGPIGHPGHSDWLLNLVLYIPLGLTITGRLTDGLSYGMPRLPGYLTAWLLASAAALVIELAQLFFAPRLATLLDVLAASVGALLGVALWASGRFHLIALWHDIRRGGRSALRSAAFLYLIGYLAFCLFPYDFIGSSPELTGRLASEQTGLWLAAEGCGDGLRCLGLLTLQALGLAPLGMILGMSSMPSRAGAVLVGLVGLVLGAAVELGHLLLQWGVAQGLSGLARAAGLIGGFWLIRALRSTALDGLRPFVRPLVLTVTPLYLWAVLRFDGVLGGTWLPRQKGIQKLAETSFLPFYYHYFTGRTAALTSLMSNVVIYGLIGLGLWLWSRGSRPPPERPMIGLAALLALGLSLLSELSKAMLDGRHPDPTNVLIAVLSAPAAMLAAGWVMRWASETPTQPRDRLLPETE
jgi:VanZ family protein